jgi:hypothetical protein
MAGANQEYSSDREWLASRVPDRACAFRGWRAGDMAEQPVIVGQELLLNYDIPGAACVIVWGLTELLTCIPLIPMVPTLAFC